MKATGRAPSWREIDQWDGGTGWIAHPDETMQRASHALVDGDDVWLVDPVDAEGLDERLSDLGTVRGAVVLLDRHTRDSAAIARRHDASVFVPEWMDDVPADVDAPVEPIRRGLPGSNYDLHKLVDNPLWKEGFLYDEDSKTLVVADALGTSSYFRAGRERLGVHPALRLTPPRSLGRFAPARILTGHGHGVFDDAAGALAEALDSARWRAPRLYAEAAREFLP